MALLWRRFGQTGLTTLLLAAAGYFLVRLFRQVDMAKIGAGLAALSRPRLALAGLTTAGSYALLSTYDYLGIRHQKAGLSCAKTLTTAFVVYAVNFNLGSLLGAVGLRYRLYTRWGLAPAAIARLTVGSAVISWTGFCLLAGLWITATRPPYPPDLGPAGATLLPFGGLALGLVALYLTWCARAQRPLKVFSWTLEVPAPREAALHLAVATAQWLLVGVTIWLMFPPQWGIGFDEVMLIYLAAAFAGVVFHIPAGLGVLEGVFAYWLEGRLPKEALLTALIAFRAVYYLLPLALAGITLGATLLGTSASPRLRHA